MKTITLPIRTVNSLNTREHWSKRAKRAKQERLLAFAALPKPFAMAMAARLPLTVLLTRIAPRAFDTDGLAASFKACRDGIADRLGVNDGSELVQWRYAQRKGEPKQYAIEILITSGLA